MTWFVVTMTAGRSSPTIANLSFKDLEGLMTCSPWGNDSTFLKIKKAEFCISFSLSVAHLRILTQKPF